jgi:hypothetical protein
MRSRFREVARCPSKRFHQQIETLSGIGSTIGGPRTARSARRAATTAGVSRRAIGGLEGFDVDPVGDCLRSPGPEEIALSHLVAQPFGRRTGGEIGHLRIGGLFPRVDEARQARGDPGPVLAAEGAAVFDVVLRAAHRPHVMAAPHQRAVKARQVGYAHEAVDIVQDHDIRSQAACYLWGVEAA